MTHSSISNIIMTKKTSKETILKYYFQTGFYKPTANTLLQWFKLISSDIFWIYDRSQTLQVSCLGFFSLSFSAAPDSTSCFILTVPIILIISTGASLTFAPTYGLVFPPDWPGPFTYRFLCVRPGPSGFFCVTLLIRFICILDSPVLTVVLNFVGFLLLQHRLTDTRMEVIHVEVMTSGKKMLNMYKKYILNAEYTILFRIILKCMSFIFCSSLTVNIILIKRQ